MSLSYTYSLVNIDYTFITAGDYYLKNNSTGKYLAVDGGADADQQNISVASFTGGNEMKIAISGAQSGHILRPHCATRIVNPYGFTVTSGLNVSLWPDVADNTQWWGFEKVDGGYVIRNVQNQNCVLDVSGTNVIVSTYTGAASQIWSVIPIVDYTVTYNANGGSGAPATQTKSYGQNLSLSGTVPTRTGYTFLSWSTSSNAATAQYQPGSVYTGNDNLTLYAVWSANSYTVVFKNWDGTVLSTKTYHYGDKVTVPANPTRAADNTYTYTFKGWDKTVAATCVGNATYTAVYNSEVKASVLSANNNLAELTVSNATISPAFSAEITNYTVNIPFEVTELNLSAVAADSNASVEVVGGDDLIAGQNNIVKVICTAENGTQKEYIVVVKRADISNSEDPTPEDPTDSINPSDPSEPSEPSNSRPSDSNADADEKEPDVQKDNETADGIAWWWLLVGGVLVVAAGMICGICLSRKKK